MYDTIHEISPLENVIEKRESDGFLITPVALSKPFPWGWYSYSIRTHAPILLHI